MDIFQQAMDQPMMLGAAVAAALVAILLVWAITRPLPPMGRWLARSLLLVAAVALAGLYFAVPVEYSMRSAGEESRDVAAERRREAEVAEQRAREDQLEVGGTERSVVRKQFQDDTPGARDTGRNGATFRSANPEDASADWDVVPVFYGTDRAREAEKGRRILYNAERARRLELGRALVTVPKSHEVPNIERPWVYRLPFTNIVIYEEAEDPKKHFTMRRVEALTQDRFLAIVKERLRNSSDFKDHALVFVHGFNTSFDFAVYRTAQMAYDLEFDGAPFMYSWPSQGKVLSYPNDRDSAQQAQPYLRNFLKLVAEQSGAKKISIVAHSMGSQLLMPVLKDLKNTLPGDTLRLSQVILAAPDMDRDGFANFTREIRGVSNGLTLYAHAKDGALDISRKFWGGVYRAGDVPPSGPVIVDGLDTIDVSALKTDIFDLNHSGFAESDELLCDIKLLIKTGTRPPEQRLRQLRRISTGNGDYWQYQTSGESGECPDAPTGGR